MQTLKHMSTEDLWDVDSGRRSIALNEIAACLEELSSERRKLVMHLMVSALIVERMNRQKQDQQKQASKPQIKLVKA